METIIIHTNFNNSIHKEYRITLDDLERPETIQKLKHLFTAPQEFDPRITTVSVTKQAAEAFASIAQHLRNQGFDGRRVAHFMTKLTFCMFAEDIKVLPGKVFTHLVESVERRPEKFAEKMRGLFATMKGGGDFGYNDIPWFNGGLFDDDDTLPLGHDGIKLVLQAARLDWSQIEPSIFGTLFERGLDPSKRSQIGAHYTDPKSIKRIIDPVLKEPLEAEWSQTKRCIELSVSAAATAAKPSARKKLLKDAEAKYDGFLMRLSSIRVLDAACGSGNFLYLALVELKNFEHRVRFEGEMYGFHRSFCEIGPQNVIGIEVNDYAAELAKITIWIGEIQWMIRNGFGVSLNPVLKRLEHIENRDALLNADGTEAEWPAADYIIGNPPFLGGSKMRGEMGLDYVNRLREAYKGRVLGGADLVTYWFEKARKCLEEGKCKRAGLVSTNSIRGGQNRKVLERICETGRIAAAWSDEPWINEGAAVRVSLVCFENSTLQMSVAGVVAESSPVYEVSALLDGRQVAEVYANLTARNFGSSGVDLTQAKPLTENKAVCYMGASKKGSFDIPENQARAWLGLPSNPNGRLNSDVIRPILNALDIARRSRGMWIIDFGCNMSESDAALYEAPFQWVVEHIKPEREKNNREAYRKFWWRHAEARPGMRGALKNFERYIVTPAHAKYRLFCWADAAILPDQATLVFARSDDTTLGILHSRFHELWALRMGTSLEDRPRYTPTTTFETFPFPLGLTPDIPATNYACNPRAQKIAVAAMELIELRDSWLNPPELVTRVPEIVSGFPDRVVPVNERAVAELKKRTLTNLYNQKPQWLVQAHRKLDEAVAAAYGWDADISDEEVLQQLLGLNQRRSVAAVARPRKAAAQKDGTRKPHQQSFMLEYSGKGKSTKVPKPVVPQHSQPSVPPTTKALRKSRKVAAGDLISVLE